MQINNNGVSNNANTTNNSGSSNTRVSADKAAERVGADSRSDSVELSSQARVITGLENRIASASDVDSGRVEALRTAIESGDYKVDADAVASGLLASDDLF